MKANRYALIIVFLFTFCPVLYGEVTREDCIKQAAVTSTERLEEILPYLQEKVEECRNNPHGSDTAWKKELGERIDCYCIARDELMKRKRDNATTEKVNTLEFQAIGK